MIQIKYSDISIFISVLIIYYFINSENDLDYIRPNKINCEKNSNNGLYCWGGYKHERDFNIILMCYRDIDSINNEQGNKKTWDFYDKLANHRATLYISIGSIVDSSKIYKDNQGNDVVNFSPCIYILEALKKIDNKKPCNTYKHHTNRYDNL